MNSMNDAMNGTMNGTMNGAMNEYLSPILGSHLSEWDLAPLDTFSFTDWVWRAVSGELDLTMTGILDGLMRAFFDGVIQNGLLIRQILVIAVLSALIRCLTDSFKAQSVGQLGSFVSYILLIATVITSFRMSASILSDLVNQVTGMMEAAVPLMISLAAMSGNVSSAAIMQPILFMGLALMARFMSYVFIPLIIGASVLHIANHLTENKVFTNIVDLINTGSKTALKFMMFLFLSLLTLQRISAPIVNNLALRTARAAAGAVPVVGGALSSAMDTVIHLSTAARSGVLVALVIVICIAVAVPLLNLLTFTVIYKLTAAVIQPICSDDMVDCLDGLGDFTGILFNAGVMVSLMFIFTCVIMLLF